MTGGNIFKSIKILLIYLLIVSFFVVYASPQSAKAASLTDISVTPSDNKPLTQNTHTVTFKTGSATKLKRIEIGWYKSLADTTKPANLSIASTFDTITGLGDTWTRDYSSAASGVIELNNSEADPAEKAAGWEISVPATITNPELGDCSVKAMSDTCFVRIDTFDETDTNIDRGESTYDIFEDPIFNYMIEGVAAGTTHNGITTTEATTFDEINFGRIGINQPEYAAQKITVVSNSPYGYEVKMKTDGYLEGMYPRNTISPFQPITDPPTTWDNPTTWDTPFGSCDTLSCSDAGWIGANTSDARVAGWSSSSGKFGPVSSNRHVVAKATARDAGTSIYVSYGVEANEQLPPDDYAVDLYYEVVSTY